MTDEMEKIRNEIGRKIIVARKAKGLTQKDLAIKLGISATRLNYWEKGKATPSVKFLNSIASILEIPSFSLILDEERLATEVRDLEAFIPYLESIGYSVIIHQLSENSCEFEVRSDDVCALFTKAEFDELKSRGKDTIDGMILLQVQKNKKEPQPAATDDGSDD